MLLHLRYSGIMTTATLDTTKAVTAPAALDFDTRLMLRSIQMDVQLSQSASKLDATLSAHDGVQEARDAAADAIAEADRYSAEVSRWEAAQTQPRTFSSNPVLSRAADIIRTRGWIQNGWTDSKGAVCALQAVRLASYGNEAAEQDALAIVMDRIRHDFNEVPRGLPVWNDRPGRTQADVLRVFG